MTTIHTVMLALLCGSACVASEASDELVSEGRTLGDDDAHALVITDMSLGVEPDICELLPSCGVCSVACDHEALLEHVPEGTCAAFFCELTDGREVSFHACHPHE